VLQSAASVPSASSALMAVSAAAAILRPLVLGAEFTSTDCITLLRLPSPLIPLCSGSLASLLLLLLLLPLLLLLLLLPLLLLMALLLWQPC